MRKAVKDVIVTGVIVGLVLSVLFILPRYCIQLYYEYNTSYTPQKVMDKYEYSQESLVYVAKYLLEYKEAEQLSDDLSISLKKVLAIGKENKDYDAAFRGHINQIKSSWNSTDDMSCGICYNAPGIRLQNEPVIYFVIDSGQRHNGFERITYTQYLYYAPELLEEYLEQDKFIMKGSGRESSYTVYFHSNEDNFIPLESGWFLYTYFSTNIG